MLKLPTKLSGKMLRPVRPSIGFEKIYQSKIEALVEEMHRSLMYWLTAKYRQNEPEIAADATPANVLKREMKRLTDQWEMNFSRGATELGLYFSIGIKDRTDQMLKTVLKRSGFSIEFKMTPVMRDAFAAVNNQNVGLIKSIASQHLSQVEQLVQESVMTGHDLGTLRDKLLQRYGVTKRRAALIARDQNAKATAAMNRARSMDLGFEEAIWLHSHAGKEPRPTHLANNGKKYSLKDGWYDSDEGRHIHPGELINCRCISGVVVPGFE